MLHRLLDRRARSERRHGRPDSEAVTERCKLGGRTDRRLAAIGHIGHQRCANRRAGATHLVRGLQSLDEHDVGTGFGVGLTAAHRLVKTQTRARIGSRDDQKVRVTTRIDHHSHLGDHLFERHHATVGGVTAFLGEFLIFDLDGADPGLFIAAHGVLHVEQTAESGIGVGDDRDRRFLDHLGDTRKHLGIGRKAGIGNAEVRSGEPEPRGVHGIETHPLGKHRRDHVEHAGRDDELAGIDLLFQSGVGHQRSTTALPQRHWTDKRGRAT